MNDRSHLHSRNKSQGNMGKAWKKIFVIRNVFKIEHENAFTITGQSLDFTGFKIREYYLT